MKSHIIPNACFKRVKQNGVATHATSSPDNPDFNDVKSYSELMLCKSCEQFLSSEYEGYSINLLSGRDLYARVFQYSDKVRIIRADLKRLHLFVLSVFWRSAVSNQDEFSRQVVLPKDLLEEFRLSILNSKIKGGLGYSLVISRLVCGRDYTYVTADELTSGIVMLPFFREDEDGFSFHWVALGYVFSLMIVYPGVVPLGSSVLRGDGSKVSAKKVEIESIPEIVKVFDNVVGR